MLKGKMNSRIILADDDADDRVIFSEALSEVRANQQLTVFSDGVELMNYLQQAAELPQLLFLDLNMPKKSGFECLKEIRTNERYKDISIAIYSTSSSRKDIDETYNRGADVYIRKPSDYSELKLVLKKVLRRRWNHLTSGFSRDTFLLGA